MPKLTTAGENIDPPKINATMTLEQMDVFVDLHGLIDVDAESKRLEKEKAKVQAQIQAKEKKLSNDKFVNNAPSEIVDRERESLDMLKNQLLKIEDALSALSTMTAGS